MVMARVEGVGVRGGVVSDGKGKGGGGARRGGEGAAVLSKTLKDPQASVQCQCLVVATAGFRRFSRSVVRILNPPHTYAATVSSSGGTGILGSDSCRGVSCRNQKLGHGMKAKQKRRRCKPGELTGEPVPARLTSVSIWSFAPEGPDPSPRTYLPRQCALAALTR